MKDIFKENGLQKILLPRTNIKPLMLLEYVGSGKAEVIGQIGELFLEDVSKLPAVNENEPAAEWSGSSFIDTGVSGNMSFLEGIWSRLGEAKLSSSYQSGDAVEFSFGNLLRDAVESEIKLNTFIRGAILNDRVIEGYRNKLNRGELYVVTYVLKSDDFNIKIIDKSSGNIKLDTDIKQIIDANIAVGHSSGISQSLKSNGGKMVIAARIKKIFYDKGNWFHNPVFELRDPKSINILDEGDFQTEDLENNQRLLEIEVGDTFHA